MLCYQTQKNGESAIESLLTVSEDANTGNLVDESCKARDPAYASSMSANSVLRYEGLPWKAGPGTGATYSISQWSKNH